MPCVGAARLVFRLPEVRQQRIEAPARDPPAVEVLALAADVDQAVDRRGAAEHLPARREDAPPVERRLGLGLVGPVHIGPREELAVAERHVDPGIRVARPGFEQQDFVAAVLGQAVGEHAARRPGANDNVVVALLHGCYIQVRGRITMTSLHKHAARGAAALALAFVFAFSASAAQKSRCDRILEKFGALLADATCVESPDLTTTNPNTTPPNNSIPGLPPFAFTPQTDRSVIAPYVPNRTTTAVPGVQINARIASDPRGQARFLLRLPDHWNGDLVVAGASGTRSEFNGDFAWSDYVLQKGYAYASQNKGTLNLILFVNPATDNLACRLNPSSPFFAHFYDNDPGQEFTRWAEYMAEAARLARRGSDARYGHEPRRTYAVGTSNGGYQVRRAVESYPQLFDGGVDWEGTFVDPDLPNILVHLPPAILNFPDYVASGRDANSTAAKNIRAAAYPPDIVATIGSATTSFWTNYSNSF